ncbi:TonB-dependent receptor [Aquimarina rhabdastrellae]
MRILILVLSFFFVLQLEAQHGQHDRKNLTQRKQTPQREVTITGIVLENISSQPLEYATVAFTNKAQQKIVTGGITNEKGAFAINVPAGIYDVSVEFIGFKTITLPNRVLQEDTDLNIIKLEEDSEALGEVQIIAEKTTVEIKLDKKIYNVGKDLTVSGGSVSDVLDNVPSVSVDVEGNVALRGNENVRILINGKPSGLVGLNSTDALRQLPAESIERVEVITSPSARYDAEGTAGILNIILRRSKIQGLNGAITANLGEPTAAGLSGNVNYRTGDVNIFTTLAYRYNEAPGNAYNFNRYFNIDDTVDLPDTFLEETRIFDRERKNFTINPGIEWYINNSTSITLSTVYRNSDADRNTNNTIVQLDELMNVTSESIRFTPLAEEDITSQYALNFNKNFNDSGHTLSIDLQYEDNTEIEDSNITVNGETSEITLQDQTNEEILLQADYVLPIGENSRFEAGYRGVFSDQVTDFMVSIFNTTTQQFELDTNVSNVLNFTQNVNAGYTQFGSKFDKFSFLLGLRLENTEIIIDQPTSGDYDRTNYLGLFPTVNLNYEISSNENITLGYARRLQRPRHWFLNPFPSRSSLTSVFQGNPALAPSYSGTYDLGYLKKFGKFTLNSSIYYQHTTDVFNIINFDTGDTVLIDGQEVAVIQRTPVNLAVNDRYGFEFTLNYSPSRKWRINTNFNFFKSVIDGDFNGVSYDADNTTWSARLNNKYTLPWAIDWQTTLRYNGPSENAQIKNEGVFSTNMAFSKDLFKEKASIAFNISDLFNSRKRKSVTTTDTFIGNNEFQWRERSFNFSFTYRFNQKKKQSRRRDYQGDDGGGDF